LIVAHLGKGTTIGVHQAGKVVDVNNGLHGDGPFSLERAGTVPSGDLVELCFSGEYSRRDLLLKLIKNSGVAGYLGTSDSVRIERRIQNGDLEAKKVYEAMAYQIAKEIGAASAVLEGRIDAIILTGSLVHGKELTEEITKRIQWISDVMIEPGENELQALAEGAVRVLNREEDAKIYPALSE
jgi:butyrate kinase